MNLHDNINHYNKILNLKKNNSSGNLVCNVKYTIL